MFLLSVCLQACKIEWRIWRIVMGSLRARRNGSTGGRIVAFLTEDSYFIQEATTSSSWSSEGGIVTEAKHRQCE